MSKWINIGATCQHCGCVLESRPVYGATLVIAGNEPMEHRHIHNSSGTCTRVIHNKAEPYSPWNLREKYYAKTQTENPSLT